MTRRDDQAGFTLLEAMVALLLLALVLAPAYSLLSGGGRAARAVDRKAQALVVAEAQFAALSAERRLVPGTYPGEGGGYRWTLTVTPRGDGPFDGAAARGMAAYRVRVDVADRDGPILDLSSTYLVAAP
ncbi:MAG: prepilin-type N-terminal cleavage/methylation domain-containing protein [Niveispirillum sp.]|uniref:prepilin-type N-terminal cleavage/methylation domain-containing protein n=1 Tax=Niveispirillum sp. TaxID=1917217 RepID=UPI003BA44F43